MVVERVRGGEGEARGGGVEGEGEGRDDPNILSIAFECVRGMGVIQRSKPLFMMYEVWVQFVGRFSRGYECGGDLVGCIL